MGKVFCGSIALDVGGHAPESDRRAVAQDERLTVGAQPHEPALTSDLFVQAAEVEHGFRAEGVSFGQEGPGAGSGAGLQDALFDSLGQSCRWGGTAWW